MAAHNRPSAPLGDLRQLPDPQRAGPQPGPHLACDRGPPPGLHLTSLGFGSQCHLDPMVGMVIAELPADYITLKLGINAISGSLTGRTYPAAAVGLVQIIRQRHPDTPMTLVSPIGCPPRETEAAPTNYTIAGMRRDLEEVHRWIGSTNGPFGGRRQGDLGSACSK